MRAVEPAAVFDKTELKQNFSIVFFLALSFLQLHPMKSVSCLCLLLFAVSSVITAVVREREVVCVL